MKKIIPLLLIIIVASYLDVNSQQKVPVQLQTKFEKSNYFETARYDESISYFNMLTSKSPYAKMISFGKSPQGRDLWCMIISKDKAFNPDAAKKTGKPIVFIENGIHSGEIEGKDASMILAREILVTKEKEKYLDNCIILIVPIFSVDGHERFGKYNRINQNGPTLMGWRTTAQNLNLNRDWMKADAPEMQSMLKFLSAWIPDFLVDTHTTDGADFQYVCNYGIEKYDNLYSETKEEVNKKFIPYMLNKMEKAGFPPAPYVYFKNDSIEGGLYEYAGPPRFSTAYGAIQNRIFLLIETHMLKPYKDRVFATREMLLTVLDYVSENARSLVNLDRRADINSVKQLTSGKYLPIAFQTTKKSSTFNWKGIKYKVEKSEISGKNKLVYTGEKYDITAPYYNDIVVTDSVKAPKGYLIPAELTDVIERLKLHGVKIQPLNNPAELNKITQYVFKDVKFAATPYEGRTRVNFNYDTIPYKGDVKNNKYYYIDVNQRTIRVIINLLEPKADDSFVKWGFLNSYFEQKEYFEDYVMEKVATQMMKDNPELKKQFEDKLQNNESFRNDAHARLNFWYKNSPYWDEKYLKYPILRVEE